MHVCYHRYKMKGKYKKGMDTKCKVKNAECYIRCRRPRARPVPHGSIELSCTCTYHILTAQQEPYRITIFFYKLSLLGKKSGEWTISSSSSSKMLADPSFYSDAYLNFSSYLGCPSTTFSLALFTGWPLCKTEC